MNTALLQTHNNIEQLQKDALLEAYAAQWRKLDKYCLIRGIMNGRRKLFGVSRSMPYLNVPSFIVAEKIEVARNALAMSGINRDGFNHLCDELLKLHNAYRKA